MDTDGYPDEKEMRRIAEWPYQDLDGLMEFVHSLWWMPNWGWRQDGETFSISTGGWSGNEDLIAALRKNYMFWSLCWLASRRGGHYEFQLPANNGLQLTGEQRPGN